MGTVETFVVSLDQHEHGNDVVLPAEHSAFAARAIRSPVNISGAPEVGLSLKFVQGRKSVELQIGPDHADSVGWGIVSARRLNAAIIMRLGPNQGTCRAQRSTGRNPTYCRGTLLGQARPTFLPIWEGQPVATDPYPRLGLTRVGARAQTITRKNKIRTNTKTRANAKAMQKQK